MNVLTRNEELLSRIRTIPREGIRINPQRLGNKEPQSPTQNKKQTKKALKTQEKDLQQEIWEKLICRKV